MVKFDLKLFSIHDLLQVDLKFQSSTTYMQDISLVNIGYI